MYRISYVVINEHCNQFLHLLFYTLICPPFSLITIDFTSLAELPLFENLCLRMLSLQRSRIEDAANVLGKFMGITSPLLFISSVLIRGALKRVQRSHFPTYELSFAFYSHPY